ncbi:MAG: exodeoxyribonuclease VII large subunit [Patescibacteria group bacterium]|nr:exodeoxyribonuclease VII large subunit [Patescibacteria group bacterium]
MKNKRNWLKVSQFLDKLNKVLGQEEYRVCGEVGRLQARGNYCFFTLKDGEDESALNCFSWINIIRLCGVDLKEGAEVVVTGYPQVYKRTGGFNFQVKAVEVVGEGALKKAFEKLKQKLKKQGLFDDEIKRSIPEFVKRVGLITSRHGEAINDFNTNIGQFGFKVSLMDCRVEGQRAVFDLARAFKFFNKRSGGFDVLVLIRGGGSFESLQAFNNEAVARAIRASKIPVVTGVGHEGDVTIADMAADFRASTPTGAAKKISERWVMARQEVLGFSRFILSGFSNSFHANSKEVEHRAAEIKGGFLKVFELFEELEEKLKTGKEKMEYSVKEKGKELEKIKKEILEGFKAQLGSGKDRLNRLGERIAAGDPRRQLKLGYNIATKKGKVIKRARDLGQGDRLDLRFWDGRARSQIKSIYK